MIDQQRLADSFMELVRIDSVSREEAAVAAYLSERLERLGARVVFDDSAGRTGSDSGNLIALLPGNVPVEPIVLCAHMDTVEPGRGVAPVFSNGLFYSSGDTILGADDKSGVAILLEVIRHLHEENIPHGPIEIVLTTCEEIGLLGAKHLDTSRLKGRFGYALDTRDTERIITRAPAANRFTLRVVGKEAHAGAKPEDGINAIWLAARAISRLELGRIDEETTCNIGVIKGGTARNVVPREVQVVAEARSHDAEKLESVTRRMIQAFEAVVAAEARVSCVEGLPRLDVALERDYDALVIPDDHRVVRLATQAAANLGRQLSVKPSGGGSDANVLFQKNIVLGVLGTGMKDVHTSSEAIALDDMARAAALVNEIIRLHALDTA